MSDSFETYRCAHCGFKTKTSARLSSHVSQSPICLGRFVTVNQLSTNSCKQYCSESPMPGSSNNHEQQHQVNDEPVESNPLYSSLLGNLHPAKQTHVEEEDTPIMTKNVFDEFKPPAGEPLQKPPNMSNDFEYLQESQWTSGDKPWAPFSSIEEWDYARWIMNSGLSQRQIDAMLALDCVRNITVRKVELQLTKL